MILVQYCPCGHTDIISESDLSEVARRKMQTRVDAPTLHSSDCAHCKENSERRDRDFTELEI